MRGIALITPRRRLSLSLTLNAFRLLLFSPGSRAGYKSRGGWARDIYTYTWRARREKERERERVKRTEREKGWQKRERERGRGRKIESEAAAAAATASSREVYNKACRGQDRWLAVVIRQVQQRRSALLYTAKPSERAHVPSETWAIPHWNVSALHTSLSPLHTLTPILPSRFLALSLSQCARVCI